VINKPLFFFKIHSGIHSLPSCCSLNVFMVVFPAQRIFWEKLWGNPLESQRSRMTLKIQEKKNLPVL